MEISFRATPFDLDFHPTKDLLVTGLINGRLHLYKYEGTSTNKLWSIRPHKESCRGVRFINEGQVVLSVSPDCSIQATNVETGQMEGRLVDAHDTAINRIVNVGPTTVATGEENGTIKVWDTRHNTCCGTVTPHEDYVSDMEFVGDTTQLLSVSGDGTLAVINLRRFKVDEKSEFSEDELLSVVRAKGGRKVICGSQEGVLLLYSWGEFADFNDRFLGHPNSVDTLVKWDEDTLITGSSDGIIRVVSILPNKMVGIVGEHSVYPLERLALSKDKAWLGSISHDNSLKLWDMNELMSDVQRLGAGISAVAAAPMDSSSDEEMEEDEMAKPSKLGKGKNKASSFFDDL